LVGLLTSELGEAGLLVDLGHFSQSVSADNGSNQLPRLSLESTRLQRRGRPGIAPEFPVLSAFQQETPTTNARKAVNVSGEIRVVKQFVKGSSSLLAQKNRGRSQMEAASK
jgi:hypothetical protein